jgi:hypothetical protein
MSVLVKWGHGRLVAFLVCACMPFAVGPAAGTAFAGASLSCGATITVNTTLHRDLLNCPSNGLIFGADGITLDLNGHVIDGNARLVASCPRDEFCDMGVVVAGRHDVTVKNGAVRDFFFGVLVVGSHRSDVVRLSLRRHFFSGLLVADSSQVNVVGNAIHGNGLTTDQAGMDVFTSDRIQIRRNSFTSNGDIGLFALEGTDHSVIAGNTFADNPEAGMLVGGVGTTVAFNRLIRNGDGIGMTGNGSVISHNLVMQAFGCGDPSDLLCGSGISFDTGRNARVVGNTIVNSRVEGIRFGFGGAKGPLTSGVVAGNVIRRAGTDAIRVDASSVRTRVVGNLAVRSGDDGIDIESRTTTLVANRAFRNGDLGIEAVAGVTDGGRNRASGNGNPAQCINVVCS